MAFVDWSRDQVEEEANFEAPDELNQIDENAIKVIGRFLPGLDRNAGGLERSLPNLITFAQGSFFMADRNRRQLPEELISKIGVKEPLVKPAKPVVVTILQVRVEESKDIAGNQQNQDLEALRPIECQPDKNNKHSQISQDSR